LQDLPLRLAPGREDLQLPRIQQPKLLDDVRFVLRNRLGLITSPLAISRVAWPSPMS